VERDELARISHPHRRLGGGYAASNSASDEVIPAQRRGVVDLAINGTWWLGTPISASAPRAQEPHPA
jgi:hypothetical protein